MTARPTNAPIAGSPAGPVVLAPAGRAGSCDTCRALYAADDLVGTAHGWTVCTRCAGTSQRHE